MMRQKTALLAAIAACVSLAGCAAMEDFATNPDKAKTRSGTGYGAAAGAVVGLLTAGNNPFRSAMIGAAAQTASVITIRTGRFGHRSACHISRAAGRALTMP